MSAPDKDLATLEAIGKIYCSAHHAGAEKDHAGMCASCRKAIASTYSRSQQCPNGHKGTCQDCEIKCQRGEAQERIKQIMAYSAPRMMFRHPLMTMTYLRKKLRKNSVS